MVILDRYIGRAVSMGIMSVLLVMITLDSLINFAGETSEIGKAHYTFWQASYYILLNIPQKVYQMFPMVALLGTMVSMGMLAGHSELVAIRASGVSIARIALSVLKTGIILTAVVIAIGEFVAPPAVQYAEMDGQVIFEWASNDAQRKLIENGVAQPGNYVFEGYNLYQLPSRTSPKSTWKRVKTWDLTTDPAVILDEQVDNSSGQVLSLPVEFGSNSGIKRDFIFDRDYIRDINKIYNGQEYYIVVTAYSRSTIPGYLPAALESDPIVYTVRPKIPYGEAFATSYGDTIAVTHTGGSDGSVVPIVVNPEASTGHTYEVHFDTSAGNTTWRVLDVTAGQTKLTGQANQSGDDNYAITDGVRIKVQGPPPGLHAGAWAWTSGSRFLTWAGGADGLGFEEFSGAVGYASPRWAYGDGQLLVAATDLKGVEIRFAASTDSVSGTFNTSQAEASYGYRYGRNFTAAAQDPAYVPYMINTTGGGYSYQDFTISVPLAVYDTDANPPRRLALGFLENNQLPTATCPASARVNGRYWPPFYNDADNTAGSGPREWLFIFDEDYSTTANPTDQTDIISGDQKVMYWAAWARRNANNWPAGNVMTLTPNRPNFVNDVFTFTLPAAASGPAQEKVSIEKVGVFPNPYYAFNAAETNRFVRFVTFNNLPPKATIRIFNLAGQLVRRLDKDDPTQFFRWDLLNSANFPVASGMYIAHLDMTLSDGSTMTKVLKFAIIQEQEILNSY